MSEPLFMNVWAGMGGHQWTDNDIRYAINTRDFCDRVARDVEAGTGRYIRRIALLRIYPKQERQP